MKIVFATAVVMSAGIRPAWAQEAAAFGLFHPVPIENAASAPLCGAYAGGLALKPDALQAGTTTMHGVPFVVGSNAVDVSQSVTGFKEPVTMRNFLTKNTQGRLAETVPAAQYRALHVLAFSRSMPGSVSRMTVRIGSDIMSNVRIEVPDIGSGAAVGDAGPPVQVQLASGGKGYLHHLRIPLAESGNSWELMRAGKMQLEFSRDVQVHVNQPEPSEFGEMPAGRPSGAVVLAATLERSPVVFSYRTDTPVAIFEDTQPALLRVAVTNISAAAVSGRVIVRCAGPGTVEEAREDRTEWTASQEYSLPVGAGREVVLDLKPKGGARGWFSCAFEGWVGDEKVQARDTSFAIIAPDTRKAADDSPFGIWAWLGGTHSQYFRGDEALERPGFVAQKGGFRWSMVQGAPEYGLRQTLINLPNNYQRIPGWYEATEFQKNIVPILQASVTNGTDAYFKVLHESRSSNALLLRVNEFLGGKPYAMPPEEDAQIAAQFAKVVEYCRAIKAARPDARIVLINDHPAVGVEYMKRGFPKELVDVFGTEGSNFMREPERQPDWLSLLGTMRVWKRAREQYGYTTQKLWTTEALYHGTSPGNLTWHKQAVIYTREAMLALANGVERMVGTGSPRDYTRPYRWSNWGCTGFCDRDPELNPKPSFAMYAWLTQVIDQAKFAGFLKTPNPSLHVLDFARADQSRVYPVWVARGRQEVSLKIGGGKPVVYDCYGNALKPAIKDGTLTVTATESPLYVTGATVDAVAGAAPVEIPADAGQVVLAFDGSRPFKAVEAKSTVLEGSWDYIRLKGNFKTEIAEEDGAKALRVELLPDDDPRTLLQRYVELALDEPVAIEGRPAAFTARVKGNGGWGRILFEMVDAKGLVWTSCGYQGRGSANTSDVKGDSFISFAGWQTMRIGLPGFYPGDDQFLAWPAFGNWWSENGAMVRVDYPLKLTRVIVAMPPRILYVNDEVPVETPVIFIDRVGVIQAPDGM